MQHRLYLPLLFLLCLSANVAHAQSEASIRALFIDPSEVEVRYFRGRLNDINDIVVALGSDGEMYRGMMRLFSSGERFLLTGRVDGNHLYLMERDTFGNRTGSIRGEIDDFEGIKADWHNFNKSLGGRLQLIPYPQEPVYPTYCGDNKWVRLYTGHIGTDSIALLLSRGTNYGLQGRLHHPTRGVSYAVAGQLLDYNRKMKLRLLDDNQVEYGQLTLAVDRVKKALAGTFTDSTAGDGYPVEMTTASELLMGCQEYTDFVTTVEVTYPKTRNSDFNAWLDTYLDDWRKSARAYTDQYKTQIPRYLPSVRSRLRSYFWCELDYYTDDLISGQIVHTHTWEASYENVPFTYDLRTGQRITLDDLLPTDDSTTTQFVRAYIDTVLATRPYADDPLFQEWLTETADFSAFTVRPEGLNFISSHNAIFGTQHVTLPWRVLAPYLRPEHPLQPLLTP